MARFEREWPYLREGKTPPPIDISGGCTLRQLCNDFVQTKQVALDAEELSPRTFRDYYQTCEMLIDHFGRERIVEDLTPADFRDFRAKLAKIYNVTTLKSLINRCSILFKYALDTELIEKPVRYGQAFKRPSAKAQRRVKNLSGPKLFSREEILLIIDACDEHLRAMVYLAVNCGFGNSDVAQLPQSAVDLEGGWINFPRPKTEISRRCPIWPETVAALRESLAKRPEPRKSMHDALCFLTHHGRPWVRMTPKKEIPPEERNGLGDNPKGPKPLTPIDSVNLRFRQLLKKLNLNGRKGLGFYTLRHVFETIGGESKDQVAVDQCMGHVDLSMAGNYRHGISDERLRAVVETVRNWLIPPEETADGMEYGDQMSEYLPPCRKPGMLESEAAFEAAFTVAKARANLTYRYQDALKKSEGQPADQYSLDWLAQLAEGIDPRTAPSKKTFENRLPAKQRTNSYSLDLPIIRDAFPKIAWPDTYREAVQMIAAKQTK